MTATMLSRRQLALVISRAVAKNRALRTAF